VQLGAREKSLTTTGSSSDDITVIVLFFFHAEDGIRDFHVTGVQTCALPIFAVAAGAGGHAGTWSPFALIAEIRQFFDKTLLLAGCLNHGHEILAAQLLGADLAYLGTRFIATQQSDAAQAYKQMIVHAQAADIVHTPAVSGVPASFMRQSLEQAGYDLKQLQNKGE